MPVVTMSEMVAALRATVGKRGMPEEDLRALADYLMSFFGFETEAIDNNLDVADRDVFYMLEEEGLLTTRQARCGGSTIGSYASSGSRPSPSRNGRRRMAMRSRCTTRCQTTSGRVSCQRDRLK